MTDSATNLHDSEISRYFTNDEANAMLPLVKVIVGDIVRLANELVDRKTRLDSIGAGNFQRVDLYSDELEQIEKTFDDDKYRLQELLEELCDLGVHPREPMQGIVGFPTRVNDELTYLTWKLGDAEVSCWDEHEQGLINDQSFESFCEQSDN